MKLDHSLQSVFPLSSISISYLKCCLQPVSDITYSSPFNGGISEFFLPYLSEQNKQIYMNGGLGSVFDSHALRWRWWEVTSIDKLMLAGCLEKSSSYPAGKLPVSQNYHFHTHLPCPNCKFESKGIMMKWTGGRQVCRELGTDNWACFLSTC